ncbi:DNA-binding transcriptional response regulator, NtrC family, contains REC, AAA-type ATPase, and a Fis-type DNA-binding domains [Sphingobacterium psychroaquaticum]|uniref:DNA-binding transcriptional response regulator, NtrC family, contains REC, AAA-type ATPase, and a Fis-type DNA-binding domains n=2 Tax=Sphingobacterium psychroaquaticum TaxID=561061 RepID=A0A1X7JPD6_9SPHI|nr:DNA-binding transcriptional response regulator, NtrC family, contains REC, AAA-type ATPase, and a Fis-type DNA-binding domains [Sphingobacterium psychroaquaticum]
MYGSVQLGIFMKKINSRILVVDDQVEVLIAAKMILKRTFETIVTLDNPKDILQTINDHSIEIVLLDMNFRVGYEDGKEGIYRLREIQEHFPQVKIILMTSYGQVERAVEGIKLGAIDYMMKPWDNEKLVHTVKETVQLVRKGRGKTVAEKETSFRGTSPAILAVYKVAERVAKTDANVLILGENGTGKFILASHLHNQSARRAKPFIHVDLGALHENLFESELFGYAKGAFTDARQDTAGRFEAAEGGTIFLDEIGNVPLHLQSKLLQVLQNRTVTRLGESKARPVDVRIITATNTDMEAAVGERLFREDLFYRINTISLSLPPLRERKEDLLAMFDYFVAQYADKYEVGSLAVEQGLSTYLMQYEWPGNIRELQNRVERAVILAEDGLIRWEHLGLTVPMSTQSQDNVLLDFERKTIEKTLEKYSGNVSRTATALGLSRPALYRKMEKYHIRIK